jgi:hypothetical protein
VPGEVMGAFGTRRTLRARESVGFTAKRLQNLAQGYLLSRLRR